MKRNISLASIALMTLLVTACSGALAVKPTVSGIKKINFEPISYVIPRKDLSFQVSVSDLISQFSKQMSDGHYERLRINGRTKSGIILERRADNGNFGSGIKYADV